MNFDILTSLLIATGLITLVFTFVFRKRFKHEKTPRVVFCVLVFLILSFTFIDIARWQQTMAMAFFAATLILLMSAGASFLLYYVWMKKQPI